MEKACSIASSLTDDEDIHLFVNIGHFFCQFSGLEMFLRNFIGLYLKIEDDEIFDTVTGSYDFSRLINIVKSLTEKISNDEAKKERMRSVCNKCLKVNESYRVPLAHASWEINNDVVSGKSKDRFLGKHFSRNKNRFEARFENPEDILQGIVLANEAMNELDALYDEISKDLTSQSLASD